MENPRLGRDSSRAPSDQSDPSIRERPASSVRLGREWIERSVAQCFEEQVARHGGRLAVRSGELSLTYDELNRAANRLARAILSVREEGQEPIGILMGKGVAAVVAILAVVKAGKIYFVLDPTDPPTRLAALVADAGAELLLCERENVRLAAEAAATGACVLDIEAIDPGLSDGNVSLVGPLSPDSLLSITYTSGSTGEPKGVLHTHRNLVHAAYARINQFALGPGDRLALLAPLSFVVASQDLHCALLCGAALLPFDVKQEGPAALGEWLDRERITACHLVPTLFRGLVAVLDDGRRLGSVRYLKTAGEPVLRGDVASFRRHFAEGCALQVGYGSSETNVIAQYVFGWDEAVLPPVVPVGYPDEGMEILLLDEAGQPVGEGEPGEILVKSRYLSPGYWRQPEATAAAFALAPGGGGERMYRTGDLGRWLADGRLEHLGRKNQQVKVRGQRVSLLAVEQTLRDVPGVENAVVVARAGPGGSNRLVAYVVPSGGTLPSTSALRQALAATLADYMIPAAYVPLAQLPLLHTGKVDLQALPDPPPERPELGNSYVPPRATIDDLEAQLTRIWERVLGVRPVGRTDNFFDLGGHSLLAGQLFADIEQRLGRRLPLSLLFRAPTVAQLAEALRAGDAPGRWGALVPIQPEGSKPPFFCVHEFGGSVMRFINLARHLGPDQPFYALQARGLNGMEAPHDTIEAIAAEYVEAIREVQPTGPYYLGGFCFGGIVAFEMARQLRGRGEQIELLAVIESFAPPRLRSWSRWGPLAPRSLARTVANLPAWYRVYGAETLRDGPGGWVRRAQRVAHRIIDRLDLRDVVSHLPNVPERYKPVMATHLRAHQQYCPSVYPGPITLLRSRALPLTQAHDPAMGWWAATSASVEIRLLPAGHDANLEEPHAPALARQLGQCLEAAQRAASQFTARGSGDSCDDLS